MSSEDTEDSAQKLDRDKNQNSDSNSMPRKINWNLVIGLVLMAFGLYNLLNLFGIVHNVELYLEIYMKLGENTGRTLIAIGSLLILGFGYILYQGDI